MIQTDDSEHLEHLDASHSLIKGRIIYITTNHYRVTVKAF